MNIEYFTFNIQSSIFNPFHRLLIDTIYIFTTFVN